MQRQQEGRHLCTYSSGGITPADDLALIGSGKIGKAKAGVETANNGIPAAATTATAGLVKQAALVPEASAEQVSKAEFKALLDALKTAGIMASA